MDIHSDYPNSYTFGPVSYGEQYGECDAHILGFPLTSGVWLALDP